MTRKGQEAKLADGIEMVTGAPLTEEERAAVELWEKGRALKNVVGVYGWDVILEMLRSYPETSIERLKRIDPSQRDEVLAEHAVMYAANRIYVAFIEDAQNAIEAADHPPDVVKKGMRAMKPGPLESQA